ncbi:MAG: hypothetical protein AAF218_07560 [Pseudomonadota bacterium]
MCAVLLLILLCLPLPALAELFRLDGETLIYDTEVAGADGIDHDHRDTLLTLLRANPDVSTLQLNSGGGKVWAAREMADLIIDFELNTHVHGICESSCVRIFLAGAGRTMSRGSQIGFHQFYWDPEDVQDYYSRKKAQFDWDTPYDMGSWIYSDTQTEMHEHLTYMIGRGVDPGFAVRTIGDNGPMWTPYRIELRAAGILTE